MTEASPSTAPVCYRHPSRETYVRCSRCDRPICPSCMNVAAVGHQCPECVAEGRKTQRPVRTAFGGSTAGQHGYVTISLIVINCAFLVASILSTKSPGNALLGNGFGGIFGGQTPLLLHLGEIGQAPYTQGGPVHGVAAGEYYRLFTAMFMHFGLIHLLLNMYALWIMGRQLEALFGPIRFAALYVVCGLGGSVAAYIFQSPNALGAGASTAVFGLFGAYFVVLRRLKLDTSRIVPIVIINVIFTLTVPGISVSGHIGGLITGLLVGFGLAHAPRAHRSQVQTAVIFGMLIVLTIATVWQTIHLHSLIPT